MTKKDGPLECFPVLTDDPGHRPATGLPGCMYCRRDVGEMHARDCVTLVRDVTYGVERRGSHPDEWVPLGEWTREDPASWTVESCRFHKNDGSWCASNIRDQGSLHFQADLLPNTPEGDCLCSSLRITPSFFGVQVRRAEH